MKFFYRMGIVSALTMFFLYIIKFTPLISAGKEKNLKQEPLLMTLSGESSLNRNSDRRPASQTKPEITEVTDLGYGDEVEKVLNGRFLIYK